MKAPAFQFYARDFLVGTAMMSAEEVGAYIRLLCYQWDNGSLPNDDATLARLGGCGGNAVASLRHKFGICDDGLLRNSRLESVRNEQDRYRARQAENAQKGWEKRKNNGSALPRHSHGNAKPHARSMPNGCSATPTATANNTINPSDEPSASSRGNTAVDPRHHQITSRWSAEFKASHGVDYVFSGRDAASLKRLLGSIRDSADQILVVAGSAWERAKSDRYAKNCKMASTLHGLCTAYNEIRVELQSLALTETGGWNQ